MFRMNGYFAYHQLYRFIPSAVMSKGPGSRPVLGRTLRLDDAS